MIDSDDFLSIEAEFKRTFDEPKTSVKVIQEEPITVTNGLITIDEISEDVETSIATDIAVMRQSEVEGTTPLYTKHEICSTWGISTDKYDTLMADANFRSKLHTASHSLKKNGEHLGVKARSLTHLMLETTLPELINRSDISATERIKAMELVVKIAGIEAKNKAQEQATQAASSPQNTGPTLNLILQTSQPVSLEKVVN